MSDRPSTLIVGAGLAGLAAAVTLVRAGRPVLLCDASDAVGGRVRTDLVDGFLLDRGFQVLLTAYPEAQRLLDYAALQLRPFYAGAYLAWRGKLRLLADPWRHPLDALRNLPESPGTWADRLRIARLRSSISLRDATHTARHWRNQPLLHPSHSTAERWRALHFSQDFQQAFLAPFFRGIFLDPDLRTVSNLFEFVFRTMAQGDTALPKEGMEAIPRQLAGQIPVSALRLRHRCLTLGAAPDGGGLAQFAVGDSVSERTSIPWDRLILAVEQPSAHHLLGWPAPPEARRTTSVYFAASRNPLPRPALVLFGEEGPVNHLAVLSAVAPSYAPPGQHLVVANLVGSAEPPTDQLLSRILSQLQSWFGDQVRQWKHRRTVSVPFAQPNQDASLAGRELGVGPLPSGVVLAGDFTTNASIDGALFSGVRAAEAVLRSFSSV